MVGGIFLVSKLFVVIIDLIVGLFIDYCKNIGKWGKFRFYLLIGSIVFVVFIVFIFLFFNVLIIGKFIYVYVFYMIWGIGYLFVNILYGLLGVVMI